jgi:hypothetical protein
MLASTLRKEYRRYSTIKLIFYNELSDQRAKRKEIIGRFENEENSVLLKLMVLEP